MLVVPVVSNTCTLSPFFKVIGLPKVIVNPLTPSDLPVVLAASNPAVGVNTAPVPAVKRLLHVTPAGAENNKFVPAT